MPPSRRAGAGAGRRGGGWGRKPPHRELRFPAAWPPPGAEGLCTFLRREKGLRLFFQFSVPSINKPPELAAFGPARRGRGEGLGRGAALLHSERKCEPLPPASLPFRRCKRLQGDASSCAVGGPTRRTPQVQPRRAPGAAKGPRNAEEHEGCRGAPDSRLQPSPARPGIGFLHKSAAG